MKVLIFGIGSVGSYVVKNIECEYITDYTILTYAKPFEKESYSITRKIRWIEVGNCSSTKEAERKISDSAGVLLTLFHTIDLVFICANLESIIASGGIGVIVKTARDLGVSVEALVGSSNQPESDAIKMRTQYALRNCWRLCQSTDHIYLTNKYPPKINRIGLNNEYTEKEYYDDWCSDSINDRIRLVYQNYY